jgi:hypothetical protein
VQGQNHIEGRNSLSLCGTRVFAHSSSPEEPLQTLLEPPALDGTTHSANSAKTPITNWGTLTPFQALTNGNLFALENAHAGRNFGLAGRRCQ